MIYLGFLAICAAIAISGFVGGWWWRGWLEHERAALHARLNDYAARPELPHPADITRAMKAEYELRRAVERQYDLETSSWRQEQAG